jgi:hypothetical protein
MLKKALAVAAVAAALGITAGPAAAVACVHLDVNLNGTQQTIDQCV